MLKSLLTVILLSFCLNEILPAQTQGHHLVYESHKTGNDTDTLDVRVAGTHSVFTTIREGKRREMIVMEEGEDNALGWHFSDDAVRILKEKMSALTEKFGKPVPEFTGQKKEILGQECREARLNYPNSRKAEIWVKELKDIRLPFFRRMFGTDEVPFVVKDFSHNGHYLQNTLTLVSFTEETFPDSLFSMNIPTWYTEPASVELATDPMTEVPEPVIETPRTTTVEFQKMLYEFGKVKEGAIVTHDFTFRNTGDAPLIIRYVKASCGCTTPHWPEQAIPPGGTGTIQLEFNSSGRKGRIGKGATVMMNTEPATYLLQLKGRVK